MSGKGESNIAVVAAVVGNLVIATIKFIAAALTGSSAMIAEGIHSLVDTGNGILVLFGIKKSAQPSDDLHPFGHGKSLYFWSLIVAVSIFGIGGGMSVYEGITHLQHPSAIENPLPNYIVLAISFLVEGTSFFIAVREFKKEKGSMSSRRFIRTSKDPSLFTVVFEDSAAMLGLVVALIGVYLGHALENPYFDGAASVVIGLILMTVAWFLASETHDLLIGEGAEPEVVTSIRALAERDTDVVAVGAVKSAYFGPDDLLVTMDVAFKPDLVTAQVHDAITRVEDSIREAHPAATRVYIEVESVESIKAL